METYWTYNEVICGKDHYNYHNSYENWKQFLSNFTRKKTKLQNQLKNKLYMLIIYAIYDSVGVEFSLVDNKEPLFLDEYLKSVMFFKVYICW